MQEVLDKFDFSIVLKSEGVGDSSEYWQEQCWQLYDSIYKAMSDGKIEPLKFQSSEGDRSDLISFFSTLAAFGITGKVFADVILDAMKAWLEYRPTAEIELKCPDGSTIKISNLPLAKLSQFFEENPQLSICEGLNRFKISRD
ncbi:hypothetical protein RSJ42_18595 [Methanosarcina hadiensis]|uniref:hypothetical protein n=1 Tax=Methanosarcina hadiensis TaxID=3078083 RepID=UPI0039778831